jgi:hypothetical protein
VINSALRNLTCGTEGIADGGEVAIDLLSIEEHDLLILRLPSARIGIKS